MNYSENVVAYNLVANLICITLFCFFQVCQPQCEDALCCSESDNINGEHNYVTIYTCTNSTNTETEIQEKARVSFMSGHSGFSFYRYLF